MTVSTPDAPARAQGGSSSFRRVVSLAKAEATLLRRNRAALFNSVLLPVLLVLAFWSGGLFEAADDSLANLIVPLMVGVTLLFVTYYNLVTTYVARREDFVLKRMRTGELTDGQVLTGTAVPTLVVTLVQIVLVWLLVGFSDGFAMPVNALLVVVAVALGAAMMVLLAAASTAFTRTAETAQVTTLPLIMVGMGLSGLFFPLDIFPETLETVARFTPLTPVIDLMHLGMSGLTTDGSHVGAAATFSEALLPAGVLLAWVLAGAYLTRRYFRWEPRR